jgi:acetyltransferase-like isoleucine patch superfamily enzyme
LIGTSHFQAVVQDFCEIHGVSVSDVLTTLEKEEFDYSELELKRIGWKSIKDFSFLIIGRGHGQGFETLRIYVGKFSYGWLTSKYFWWGREKEGTAGLNIGRFVQIGPNVQFFLGGGHCYKRVAMFPFDDLGFGFQNVSGVYDARIFRSKLCQYSRGPIVIGNDVWIGDGVTIMSGVTVGDGAIIGAGSIVREDVPPYAIVVGNPAVVRDYRHPPVAVQKLMDIKWWNWDEELIASNYELLLGMDVDKFIDAHWVPR